MAHDNGFQHIAGHNGAMTLEIGGKGGNGHVGAVLSYLSREFFWLGLTHVRLYLTDAESAESLVRLITARRAGAQGASREQYEAIANNGTTAAADMTFSGPPLCKHVVWWVHYYQKLPDETYHMAPDAG